jgi:hypothetical protein
MEDPSFFCKEPNCSLALYRRKKDLPLYTLGFYALRFTWGFSHWRRRRRRYPRTRPASISWTRAHIDVKLSIELRGKFLFSSGVNESATRSIVTRPSGMESLADLGLVLWMSDHWTKLVGAMGKLALVSIATGSSIFKGSAEFSFVEALVAKLFFDRSFFLGGLTSLFL